MFDMGWGELLVIAVVSILFVKPHDLVPMLQSLFRGVHALRSMILDVQDLLGEALRDERDDSERGTKLLSRTEVEQQCPSACGGIGEDFPLARMGAAMQASSSLPSSSSGGADCSVASENAFESGVTSSVDADAGEGSERALKW